MPAPRRPSLLPRFPALQLRTQVVRGSGSADQGDGQAGGDELLVSSVGPLTGDGDGERFALGLAVGESGGFALGGEEEVVRFGVTDLGERGKGGRGRGSEGGKTGEQRFERPARERAEANEPRCLSASVRCRSYQKTK